MEIDSRLGVSPDHGFPSTLTPTRSQKSSNAGISSSNASIDGNDNDRSLLDKLKLDKFKIGGRRSVDERRKSVDVGRRFSKLIAPKRRKRQDAEEAAAEEARGRKEGDASASDLASITSSINRPQRRDSVASSLLTDEDTEYVQSNLHLAYTCAAAGFVTNGRCQDKSESASSRRLTVTVSFCLKMHSSFLLVPLSYHLY